MREDVQRIAQRFGIMDRIEKLEADLLAVDGVAEVDFDISGFLDRIDQVILIPKYDIDVKRPDYYAARRKMLNHIIEVAHDHGLHQSGDGIEDYGEHFYIVRNCDETWKPRFGEVRVWQS